MLTLFPLPAGRLCVVVGVSLLMAAAAAAQNAGPLHLSLDEARARALTSSRRVAEARARAGAAGDAVAVRQAAARPLVALAAGYTRTNHVTEFVVPSPAGPPRVLYPDVPDNYRARLDLQWPIYNGRTEGLVLGASAEAAAAVADAGASEADLRLEVSRAFWALVTADSTARVLEQSIARAQAHLNEVRQRFDVGLIPPNEVSSAEAQLSRQRMLLIEARNQRSLASADLARLVGADLLQPIEPMEALDGPAAGSSGLDDLVAEARAMRHERRALEHRLAAAGAQGAAAAAARRPAVALTGGIDYARPNPRIFPRTDRWDDSWDVGVAVTWSLWDGGRARAEMAQAGSGAAAARLRLEEFDSAVALEVHQRLLDIDSGRAAVSAAGDAVRAAADAHRVVTERYRAGVVAHSEVLDAELALLQAELDRTRALAGVRLAEARLARALGR